MSFELTGRIKIKDDGASRALKQVTQATDMARKAAEQYSDEIGSLQNEQSLFVSGINRVSGALTSLTSKFTKLAGVGVAAAANKAYDFARDSVVKAMDFEAQISSIQALSGASTEEMAKMQSLALKMGANSKYNALEVAQGIEELLKAGINPATVQAGGLEAAINLATAGGLELADAADIMSTALNAYKKDGMSAGTASNIFAGTAQASATGLEDLRQSLAEVSAVASGVGLTFEDTNIALGILSKNGLRGSAAGASLTTILQNLQPTTEDQVALFRSLGLVTEEGSNAFYDTKGNIESLQSISGTLHKSLEKLTDKQRDLAMKTMFGTDAIRAANILYEEGSDGVKDFQTAMSKVSALDVAKQKMDNAAGAVDQFKGALETLQISALLPTMPLIQRFATSAANMVERYTPEITAAIDRMSNRVTQYFNNHFSNNPEFQKISTLEGKIKFVFEDVMESFKIWMDSGGKAKIEGIAHDTVDTFGKALKASESMLEAASTIGKEVGKSILSGLEELAKENPALTGIMAGLAVPGPIQLKVAVASGVIAQGYTDQATDWLMNSSIVNDVAKIVTDPPPVLAKTGDFLFGPLPPQEERKSKPLWKQILGFAGGLDYVPYDNFPARLHKGETVLTRTEATAYREGNGKPSVIVTGNTFNIREEGDIDAVARRLAYLLAQ